MEISVRKVAQVILMGHELDRAEGELRAFIDRLNEDEAAELVAMFWIGRGSFEAEDWAEALATAGPRRRCPRRITFSAARISPTTWRPGPRRWASTSRTRKTT
jgi:hypothetical protein